MIEKDSAIKKNTAVESSVKTQSSLPDRESASRTLTQPIYLCTGGTGGHIFPAIAVANVLSQKGVPVTLLCDKDVACDKNAGEQTFSVVNIPLRRKPRTFLQRLLFACSLLMHMMRYVILFLKSRPAMVVGFGGYSSFAAVGIAQLLKIPTILHEQNAYLGKANRYLLKRALHLATSLPRTIIPSKAPHSFPMTITGNPVRIAPCSPYHAKKKGDVLSLFVLGGSQGAKIFSELLPKSFELLNDTERCSFSIIQQCREELLSSTKKAYEHLGFTVCEDIISFEQHQSIQKRPVVFLAPFFHTMQKFYEQSDLVMARSGASTVSEITVAGRAAFFIPYPFATDDHQYCNALSLKDSCFVAKESTINPENMAHFLRTILENPDILLKKAEIVRTYTMEHASQSLAQLILNLLPRTE